MQHIIVVEDDAANARLLEVILQRAGGFQVTVTEDAAFVVEAARNGEVDLVVMDVSLSNSEYQGELVDGLDLSRILKCDPATRHIPIILTTAHAMRGDRERFLGLSGADEYIPKPIEDNQALVALIRAIIFDASKAA